MFQYFADDEPPKNVRLDTGSITTVEILDHTGTPFKVESTPNFYHIVFCYPDEDWIR